MADLTYLRLVNTTTLFGLERMSSQRCSLNSRLIDNNDDLKERISVIPSYHFVYLGLSSISDSIFQQIDQIVIESSSLEDKRRLLEFITVFSFQKKSFLLNNVQKKICINHRPFHCKGIIESFIIEERSKSIYNEETKV